MDKISLALSEDIKKIETLLNSIKGEKIEQLHPFERGAKPKSVEELKADFEIIKQRFNNLTTLHGASFYEERNDIYSKLWKIEFAIDEYIANGELSRVLQDQIDRIKVDAEDIQNSPEGITERKNNLDMLKKRYNDILNYAKQTETFLNTSEVEQAIAKVIVSILRERYSQGEEINLQKDIDRQYTHSIYLLIQQEIENAQANGTNIQKELASRIQNEMERQVVQEGEKKSKNGYGVVHNANIMNMYLTLDQSDEKITGVLIGALSNNIIVGEERKIDSEVALPNRNKTEVYKELIGMSGENTRDESFQEYRERKLREYQEMTKRWLPIGQKQIEPEDGYITIITQKNKVKKIKIEDLKEDTNRKKLLKNAKIVITANGTKTIPEKLFYEADISEVLLNEGLESIGKSAFECTSLEGIEMPSTVKDIGEGAFGYCGSLKQAKLNEGLESIGENAFKMTGLEGIEMPPTIRNIGPGAFWGCESLEQAKLNEGLEDIGSDAFRTTGLKRIEIPSTVKVIGAGAFFFCESLKQAKLNAGLESIGVNAFASTGLEGIEMPPTIRNIEQGAFWGCGSLKQAKLNAGLESIGRDAFGGTELERIEIPSTVKVIGERAFFCILLKTAKLSRKCRIIGDVFYNCRNVNYSNDDITTKKENGTQVLNDSRSEDEIAKKIEQLQKELNQIREQQARESGKNIGE